jgi:outer membrane protein
MTSGPAKADDAEMYAEQVRCARAWYRSGVRCLANMALVTVGLIGPTSAETLSDALVRTYRDNPQLNAERARLRGVDETVPQALAGYRPQIMAVLTGGLQQVRALFFDNTIQTATLNAGPSG